MSGELESISIGYALTGSHCTLSESLEQIEILRGMGAVITPIISGSVGGSATRFGWPEEWREKILAAAESTDIIEIISEAEPIGPRALLDIMVIAPCTGNTLAKMANGICDSAVLMAAKATLRNKKPVLLAIATNDGLGANARNIGQLLNCRNIYFVPFGQDDPFGKPNSLIAHFDRLPQAVIFALAGEQLQPLLVASR
jgi:dipicolinate synthase subunit B